MTIEQQKLIWQAEITHPELAESAKNGLREVVDPEIGLNVIELGLIRDLVINPDNAQLTMILTTPFCPYGPALMEVARQKTEKALNRTTTLLYSPEMWDPTMMEEGAGAEWGLF